MNNPLVSVIIPTVGEKTLLDCVNAVHHSTYENIEIIVVREGLERSAQRNIGIDRAKGEYLLILDSDMLISSYLIKDCVAKIKRAGGVYLQERIITKGWFGRLRDWERQFYTGTLVDVVRFVRRKDCPRFDEEQHGTEDSDWDRLITGKKVVSDYCYDHKDNIGLIDYLKKKAYYAKSLGKYSIKNPDDRLLTFRYRCVQVFIENGKWKRLLTKPHYALGVALLLLA